MIQTPIFKQLIILFVLFAVLSPARATVVRMDFSIGEQAADPVYIELFDLDTLVTIEPPAQDALAAAFSIDKETCSGTVLAAVQTCSIDIRFQAEQAGQQRDQLTLAPIRGRHSVR